MGRKREKPYPSRHDRFPLPKRVRPIPPRPQSSASDEMPHPPPAVVVLGLTSSCSVLELKSRFEIYGAISRIRIDRKGVGYVTYRSKDSAQAAVAAALDAAFGITVDSQKVEVLWATDPLAKWREGVGVGGNKDSGNGSSSKLLRAELPLRRHGRGNKLASTIVNPTSSSSNRGSSSSVLDVPFKGREIVAYDDIL